MNESSRWKDHDAEELEVVKDTLSLRLRSVIAGGPDRSWEVRAKQAIQDISTYLNPQLPTPEELAAEIVYGIEERMAVNVPVAIQSAIAAKIRAAIDADRKSR